MDRKLLLFRFLGSFVGVILPMGLIFSFAYGASFLGALAKVVWPAMVISLYYALFPAPKRFSSKSLIHGVVGGLLVALAFKYLAF